MRNLHSVCLPERKQLIVGHDTFLKIFKINNNHVRILQTTNRIVADIKAMENQFDEHRKLFGSKDQVDLIFEFQAWMSQQIIVAQKRLAIENNFTFFGEEAANESGKVTSRYNRTQYNGNSVL